MRKRRRREDEIITALIVIFALGAVLVVGGRVDFLGGLGELSSNRASVAPQVPGTASQETTPELPDVGIASPTAPPEVILRLYRPFRAPAHQQTRRCGHGYTLGNQGCHSDANNFTHGDSDRTINADAHSYA